MKIRKLVTATVAATALTAGMAAPAAAEPTLSDTVAQDNTGTSLVDFANQPVTGSLAMPALMGIFIAANLISLLIPGTGCSLLNASANCSPK